MGSHGITALRANRFTCDICNAVTRRNAVDRLHTGHIYHLHTLHLLHTPRCDSITIKYAAWPGGRAGWTQRWWMRRQSLAIGRGQERLEHLCRDLGCEW